MKIAEWICRIILGLGFVVFGALYFLPIEMQQPPPANPIAGAWIAGLSGAPHYLSLVKVVELLGGALVLTGIALPLGLILLAPLVINIVYFNSYLSAQPGIDLLLLTAGLVLAWMYWPQFKPLFSRSRCCQKK